MKHSLSYNLLILSSSLGLALMGGAGLFLLVGASPWQAYSLILTQPLQSLFGLSEVLLRATPLLLMGLGMAIAFKGGLFNIGGEGQMLLGATASAWVGITWSHLPLGILFPLVFVAGFMGGALWAGLAGWLKAYCGVNEILSTVMLNYVAIHLCSFLLRGPLMDPQELSKGTGLAQTALLNQDLWLQRLIPGLRLHTGIIFALSMALIIYLLLWRTTWGYQLRACGSEARAARYAGIHVKSSIILALCLSGGLAGLAGTVELCGIHHRGLESLSAGYGFSGLVVALLGGLHPLGIVLASTVFGLLMVGSDMMQRSVHIPAHIVVALQGLIILAVVSCSSFLRPYFKPKTQNTQQPTPKQSPTNQLLKTAAQNYLPTQDNPKPYEPKPCS